VLIFLLLWHNSFFDAKIITVINELQYLKKFTCRSNTCRGDRPGRPSLKIKSAFCSRTAQKSSKGQLFCHGGEYSDRGVVRYGDRAAFWGRNCRLHGACGSVLAAACFGCGVARWHEALC